MRGHGPLKSLLDHQDVPILPAFEEQLRATTALLAQAKLFAQDAGCNIWKFAVDIRQLRSLGVPDILLKWLLIRRYVEHRPIMQQKDGNGTDLPESLALLDTSAFVLTAQGDQFVQRLSSNWPALGAHFSHALPAAAPAGDVRIPSGPPVRAQAMIKPYWDVICKQLWFSDKLVKQFKLPSVNQETVLMAFEEEGWSQRVDDPLPPHPNQNPHVRLGNTIKALNRNQKHKVLQFRGDGSGEGVLWEPCSGH